MITLVEQGIRIDVSAARERLRSAGSLDTGVRLQFLTQADDRVRPEHAALHGTVWDPYDPERPVPPLDYGCRCYLRPVATSRSVAEDRGLPLVRNPPQTPDEAVRLMLADAAASGEDVTMESLFGPQTAAALDSGGISVSDLIGPDGEKIAALEATILASGVRRSLMVATLTALRGMGIGNREIRSVIAEAKRQTGTRIQRIRAALAIVQPGAIAGRTQRTTDARIDRAARLIDRVAGGLL